MENRKPTAKRIIKLNELPPSRYSDLILQSREFKTFLDSFYAAEGHDEDGTLEDFGFLNGDGLVSFADGVLRRDALLLARLSALPNERRLVLLRLIDAVYDFWRRSERYVFYINKGDVADITPREFTQKCTDFATLVQGLYRDVYEGVLGHGQTIYRNIPAGGNAGMLYRYSHVDLPAELSFLNACPLMESVVIFPPFICATRQNKRVGYFAEKNVRLRAADIDSANMSGVMIRIGAKRGLVYIDKEYQGFLVAIGNLFQLDSRVGAEYGKPDFVLVFGALNAEDESYYYRDGSFLVGVCPKKANVDYFGYVKKMILTLYNLLTIDEGKLPIHGAGVELHFRDGRVRNIVILGDSGAGKSETLEALRTLAGDYIDKMVTIFDDMGTLSLAGGKVYATGTETGAFVRLDDLEKGYSLRSLDRSVFLNIDVPNSRVVLPAETFATASTPHRLDMFLLADNFTDTMKGIGFYDDIAQAQAAFAKAERMAVGTTSESGIVSTFLGNPFGPQQEREKVMGYLANYFQTMAHNNTPVGRLYTRLAIAGAEGPLTGARILLETVRNMK